MESVLNVKQDLAATMNLVLVNVEDRFNQRQKPDCSGKLVEVYDASFAKEPGFQPYGQYIGGYCTESFAYFENTDLIINSRVPQWFLEASGVQKVRNWLQELSADKG